MYDNMIVNSYCLQQGKQTHAVVEQTARHPHVSLFNSFRMSFLFHLVARY